MWLFDRKINSWMIVFFCCCLVLITSCKTTNKVTSLSGMSGLKEMDYLEKVITNAPDMRAFTSKVKLTVNLGGKDMTVNGNLRMKKDEVIQLSIVPILGIEVAKIEISKDSVLVIDRMNKQYIKESLNSVKFLTEANVDFYTLQALFFNELFLPGNQAVDQMDLAAFSVQKEKDKMLIRVKKSKDLHFHFITSLNDGLLTESVINSDRGYQLSWKYADFSPLAGKSFPSRMNLALDSSHKKLSAQLDLSRMNINNDWTVNTTVSGRYQRIDAEQLFKRLLGL